MQIISEVEQLLVTDPGTTRDKERIKIHIHDVVQMKVKSKILLILFGSP